MLKYYKFITSCLLCCSFFSAINSEVKADYFTDYNTTVMDTILRDNIFNFDIFTS